MDGAADVVNKAYAMAQQQNTRALLDAQPPAPPSFLSRTWKGLFTMATTEEGKLGLGVGIVGGLLLAKLWKKKGR